MKEACSKTILLMSIFFISVISLCSSSFAYSRREVYDSFKRQIANLEVSSGGRIGVSALDTGNNMHLEYRSHERFPMGCTSKVIGVAAILEKSMAHKNLLKKKVSYTENDIVSWSPITKKHIEKGMTVKSLCAAAISYSDNTAMNLLVKQLGGLKAINAFAWSIHDYSFRQDTLWPGEARSGGRGNLKDSTTPAAMERSIEKLTAGQVLAPYQRSLLISWLKHNHTGGNRIRVGVPKGWLVGDKTGTGSQYGTTNDIAILWPPHHSPIILTIYYTNPNKKAVKREDIVASVTRIAVNKIREDGNFRQYLCKPSRKICQLWVKNRTENMCGI